MEGTVYDSHTGSGSLSFKEAVTQPQGGGAAQAGR